MLFQPFLRNSNETLPYPAINRRAIIGHLFEMKQMLDGLRYASPRHGGNAGGKLRARSVFAEATTRRAETRLTFGVHFISKLLIQKKMRANIFYL
jgi:hypothetical protein